MGKLRHGWGVERLGSRAGRWGARGPSEALAAFQVLWQSQTLQEPKNKRSCWPGLCKSVSLSRPAREFGGFGGKPGRAQLDAGTGPRKCQFPKGWGLPPSLSPPCAALWLERGSV